jgi:transposase
MKRFIEGEDRSQSTLFPEHLEDYIAEDNPVRVIDVFVDELDLRHWLRERMGTWPPEYVRQQWTY